jgi:hypothetical protein
MISPYRTLTRSGLCFLGEEQLQPLARIITILRKVIL